MLGVLGVANGTVLDVMATTDGSIAISKSNMAIGVTSGSMSNSVVASIGMLVIVIVAIAVNNIIGP